MLKNLSKGMRAKVSLALAMAHEPELLVLDEPTSGLDTLVRREFLESQLKPELLRQACRDFGVPLDLRLQDGYDHSYFFIATFIEDHLRFHAENLR